MFVSSPADVTPEELHWIAGLLEGEGSFFPGPPSKPNLPIIQIQMTDEDVMRRLGHHLGRTPVACTPKMEHWRPTWKFRVVGRQAVRWMEALRPLMGERRQRQIDAAIASFAPQDRQLLDDLAAQAALDQLAAGASVRDVAEEFGTSVWCIYDLRLGRTHKALDRSGVRQAADARASTRRSTGTRPA